MNKHINRTTIARLIGAHLIAVALLNACAYPVSEPDEISSIEVATATEERPASLEATSIATEPPLEVITSTVAPPTETDEEKIELRAFELSPISESNANSIAELARYAKLPSLRNVEWSPASDVLAFHAYGKKVLYLWDMPSGEIETVQSGGISLMGFDWSPDGRYLVVAGGNVGEKAVAVLDMENRESLRFLNYDDTAIVGASWSPDGSMISGWGLRNGKVYVWQASTGELLDAYYDLSHGPGDDPDNQVLWSPSGELLAFRIRGQAVAQSINNGRIGNVIEQLGKPGLIPDAFAWSSNGAYIAVGIGDGGVFIYETNSVFLDSGVNSQPKIQLDGHIRGETQGLGLPGVASLSWSPDSKYLVSGGTDFTMKLWDVETGTLLRTFLLTDHVISVAWSPDGTRIASADDDGNVIIWGLPKDA